MDKRYAKSVTGKVLRLDRLKNSPNGNPRFIVTLDNEHTYKLGNDAALGYGIENPEYFDTDHEFGLTSVGNLNGYCRAVN